MDPVQKRIERAWQNSKDWITEFDGSATEAYLTNAAVERLPQTFAELAGQFKTFRVSTISTEDEEVSEFVSPESIAENVARLQRGEIAGLNVNASTRLEGFDLDLHIIVNTIGSRKVDLEMVWWSDQIFPEDVEPRSRFDALVRYFIQLQDQFKAAKLYIGPETFDKPSPGSLSWVEI
jgi:hypothetical protein